MAKRKKYKFRSFIFDAAMVIATGGLWLIRIYVRENRNR
jgi:hypothetical protein